MIIHVGRPGARRTEQVDLHLGLDPRARTAVLVRAARAPAVAVVEQVDEHKEKDKGERHAED